MCPASRGGLQVGDVLVSVNDTLVTLMTHDEIVQLIRSVSGGSVTLQVQRGDHVVPNIKECFPEEAAKTNCQVYKMGKQEHNIRLLNKSSNTF